MKQERQNTNPHILHYRIKRNKNFPNSTLPVLIYKQALKLPRQKNKSAEIAQQIFLRNGWSNSWRNGIYDFHHYHSNTHECMAIASGNATVLLGGPGGKKAKLGQGDVIILPAGTGHKCMKCSEDFFCVGVYPQGRDYDMNYGTATGFKKALERTGKVPVPKKDPVYGKDGFLKMYWK